MKERNDPDKSNGPARQEHGSSFVVSVLNRQRSRDVDVARVVRTVKACLHGLHMSDAEVSVVLVSDRFMRKLNWQYLQRKGPTDVFAFSLREGPCGDVTPSMLGDIVISIETAARQARDLGTSLEKELDVLTTHGLLHLLGYDHTISKGEARRMWRRQQSLLRMLGVE